MLAWVHTYDYHVQVFMDHVTTEKPAFIDKNWNSFVTPYVLKITIVQSRTYAPKDYTLLRKEILRHYLMILSKSSCMVKFQTLIYTNIKLFEIPKIS